MLFINGYAANKSDHSLTAPLCYIYDMATGTLSDVSNGNYIFGAAADAAGKRLLTAWSLGEFNTSVFTIYNVDPAGVNDATIGKNGVKIFATDAVLYASEACDVEITALSGAKVAAAKGVTSLDVTALPAGLYVAKATTATGTTTVKFIKK